jgi:hypothetical protein
MRAIASDAAFLKKNSTASRKGKWNALAAIELFAWEHQVPLSIALPW